MPNFSDYFHPLASVLFRNTKQPVSKIPLISIPSTASQNIPLIAPVSTHFISGLKSIWHSKRTMVPLHTKSSLDEFSYYINDLESNHILIHPQYTSLGNELLNRFPNLQIQYLSEENHKKEIQNDFYFEPNDPAVMIYTSGTTGFPKGVLHTHASIWNQISILKDAWLWTSKDHLLHCLPLHHIHGLVNCLLCCLSSGATWDIRLAEKEKNFDLNRFFDLLSNDEQSPDSNLVFMAVPTIYDGIIRKFNELKPEEQAKIRKKLQQFRLFVSGSAALPQPLYDNWLKIGQNQPQFKILERYGMTEIGMALSNDIDPKYRFPGSVGSPLPTVKVKLQKVNQNGEYEEITKLNEPGELFVQSPSLFQSYWKKPLETQKEFSNGWFKTGDVACMSERNCKIIYQILGRASVDIIKSGGYKLSALEIERILLEHPSIREISIFGMPDDKWGEVLVGFCVPDSKANLSDLKIDKLKEWMDLKLSKYKQPTQLKIVSEIPKNAMGKVNKKHLKRIFQSQ